MKQIGSQSTTGKPLRWAFISIAIVGFFVLFSDSDSSPPSELLVSLNKASDDADLFCEAVRGTGESECSVREAEREIATFLNASNSEAIKICRGMVMLAQNHTNALSGWRLKIYLSSSRYDLLASCRF